MWPSHVPSFKFLKLVSLEDGDTNTIEVRYDLATALDSATVVVADNSFPVAVIPNSPHHRDDVAWITLLLRALQELDVSK